MQNSITLVTIIIIMLLELYRVIFRTLAYVTPEPHLRTLHIEIPGIVRTVYSGIFRDNQQYPAMFRHIERQ